MPRSGGLKRHGTGRGITDVEKGHLPHPWRTERHLAGRAISLDDDDPAGT
ncbi:MAG: hypothetical protein ABSA91_13455 [Acidimicrobiales bacterium]